MSVKVCHNILQVLQIRNTTVEISLKSENKELKDYNFNLQRQEVTKERQVVDKALSYWG